MFFALLTCLALLISSTRVGANPCPIHFKEREIDGRPSCIGPLISKHWLGNRSFCKRRLTIADLPELGDFLRELIVEFGDTKVMIDVGPQYKGGPLFDRNTLEPLEYVVQGEPSSRYPNDCATYDIYDRVIRTREMCDSGYALLCIFDQPENVTRGPCRGGFYYIEEPKPTCITKRIVTKSNLDWKNMQHLCWKKDAELLGDEYIYTNNAFLLRNQSVEVVTPTACEHDNYFKFMNLESGSNVKEIYLNGTKLHYISSNTPHFNQVFCTHEVDIEAEKIHLKKESIIDSSFVEKESLVVRIEDERKKLPEIACFTDDGGQPSSNRLARVETVKLNDHSAMLKVGKGNGHYWCNAVRGERGRTLVDSDHVLWIGNETLAQRTVPMVINYKYKIRYNDVDKDAIQHYLEKFWTPSTMPKFTYKHFPGIQKAIAMLINPAPMKDWVDLTAEDCCYFLMNSDARKRPKIIYDITRDELVYGHPYLSPKFEKNMNFFRSYQNLRKFPILQNLLKSIKRTNIKSGVDAHAEFGNDFYAILFCSIFVEL